MNIRAIEIEIGDTISVDGEPRVVNRIRRYLVSECMDVWVKDGPRLWFRWDSSVHLHI